MKINWTSLPGKANIKFCANSFLFRYNLHLLDTWKLFENLSLYVFTQKIPDGETLDTVFQTDSAFVLLCLAD